MDCEVTWSVLTGLKDIVLAAAAIVGATTAVRGLRTWKRQLNGTVEFDLARRILLSTYHLREGIGQVRNPIMWNTEQPRPPKEEADQMSSEQIDFYGRRSAYGNRWSKVSDARSELQALLLEAEVLWGKEFSSAFDSLFKLQNELFRNVYAYLRSTNPDEDLGSREAHQKIFAKQRDILYATGGDDEEDDPYEAEMQVAIKKIEIKIRPLLHK